MTRGPANAPDSVIFAWAAENSHIVLTCDLDFSQLLAVSGAAKPSVITLREHDVTVATMGEKVLRVLAENADVLARGALVMLDASRSRVRVLPLRAQ